MAVVMDIWLDNYGLFIDNLLEVKLVLADGKTVIASRHKNSQLFWAIRGAGASFGALLSFNLQAYAMRTPVWGGTPVIGISELQKVVPFANDLFMVCAFGKHQLLSFIHFCRSEVQSDTLSEPDRHDLGLQGRIS